MLMTTLISMMIGVAAIVVSANIFLFLSTQLARRFKLSPLIISVIVIGLVTTLPEMTVTLFAIQQSDVGLALGNVLGSYVTNLLLVLALAISIGKVKIGTLKTQRTALILLFVTFMFIALQFSAVLPQRAGWLLLIMLLISFALQLVMGVNGRNHEDKKFIKQINMLNKKQGLRPIWLLLILALLSVAGLAVGGNITVSAAGKLAVILGLSTTFLGMTLVALSTSLPELITIILAQRKHENKVVVGTILGSNTINITLFPGLIFLLTGQAKVGNLELIYVGLAAVVITYLIFRFRGKVISSRIGYPLLAAYGLFLLLSYILE